MEGTTVVDQETKKPIDVEPSPEFAEKEAIKNVSTFSSEKLGDIVVMYQYLSLYHDLSVAAMQELALRREKGEIFDYEGYISLNLNKLPKLSFELPPLNTLVNQLKRML